MKLRTYKKIKEYKDDNGGIHTVIIYGELTETKKVQGFAITPVSCDRGGNVTSITNRSTIYRDTDRGRTKCLNFGWAVCQPCDNFDEQKGIEMAKKRFSRCGITTQDGRLLSDDMIDAILENEAYYIINEKVIKKINEKAASKCETSEKKCDELQNGVIYKITWTDSSAITYACVKEGEECYWGYTENNQDDGTRLYFKSPFTIGSDTVQLITKATRNEVKRVEKTIEERFSRRWDWKNKEIVNLGNPLLHFFEEC